MYTRTLYTTHIYTSIFMYKLQHPIDTYVDTYVDEKSNLTLPVSEVIEETHGYWKKLRETGHGGLWVG